MDQRLAQIRKWGPLLARLWFYEARLRWHRFHEALAQHRAEVIIRRRFHRAIAERERLDPRNRAGRRTTRFRR
jgi:hypothetical protein